MDLCKDTNLNISLSPSEENFLKQYAQVYDKERIIDATSDPIVAVETEIKRSTNPDYDNGEYYYVDDIKGYSTNSLEQMKKYLKENYEGSLDEFEISEILRLLENKEKAMSWNRYSFSVVFMETIYKPVAYFLTRKEAEKYCKYQRHNLVNPRIYSYGLGYGNHGDLQCLRYFLLRVGNMLLNNHK